MAHIGAPFSPPKGGGVGYRSPPQSPQGGEEWVIGAPRSPPKGGKSGFLALMGLIGLISLMGLIGLISLLRKLLRGRGWVFFALPSLGEGLGVGVFLLSPPLGRGWGWVLFALGVGLRQCFRIVKAAFGIAP